MRVTVMGAGGYIGSRLVPALLAAGHDVTATFTDAARAQRFPWAPRVQVAGLDVADRASARAAVKGSDALVYLVHGLAGPDFSTADREGAYNAAHASVRARTGRIVYLGGLVPDVPEAELSPHLRSRLEVEQVFGDSGVPTWGLRAAMVVGAGSTSFEIMRQLSRRLPVQVVPSWMRSTVEPVAVSDVVAALVGALTAPGKGRTYDVGSGERMSYAALLRLYARVAGGRALQVPALLPTALVARVAPLFTDVPASTVRSLVASLRHDMVCRDDDYVRDLLPAGSRPVPVAQAMARALAAPPAGTAAANASQGPVSQEPASQGLDPLGPLPTDPAWARPPA
ncbi:hypothetical protein GCM10027517_35400 [Phycicoccus ginsengisoli]